MHAFFQEKNDGTFINPRIRKLIYIPDADISIDYTDDDVVVLKGKGDFIMAPVIQIFPEKIVHQALFVFTNSKNPIGNEQKILQSMLLQFFAENMIELLKEKDRLRRI